MADFKVEVVKIDDVVKHPNADRLKICKIRGFDCITSDLEDGSPRYKAGDYVVYIPEAAIVTDWLLKKMGFWDEANGVGTLSGGRKNRVKIIKLRGTYSQGIMYPVSLEEGKLYIKTEPQQAEIIINGTDMSSQFTPLILDEASVEEGEDVAELLGITKYEPAVPQQMRGVVGSLFGYTKSYDIPNIQGFPDVFKDGEEVVVTEKLHGCADFDSIINTLEFGEQKIGNIVTNKTECHVESFDLKTNEIVYQKIEGWSEKENNDDWYEIALENGTTLKLTGNHPIYIPYLKCYRNVRDLNGDEIVLMTEK